MIVTFEGKQHNFPDDATEEEITAALGGDTAPEKPSAPITAQGSYNALESGARKGLAALAGAPGDLAGLLNTGIDAGTNLVQRQLGMPETQFQKRPDLLPTYQSMTDQLNKNYGPVGGDPNYKPGNLLEEGIERTAEFGPALFGGAASIPARLARTVGPALTSKAGGIVARNIDPSLEPVGDVAGGFAAPGIAAAGRRIGTPLPQANAGRQGMVNTLEAEGVVPTAGQRSGSKALQYSESSLGDFPFAGGRATAQQNLAQEQFTQAALRRIGHQGEATPAGVNASVQNIQNEFQRLSANSTLRFDNDFARDLTQTAQRYNRKLPSQQRQVIDNIMNDLADVAQQNQGTMPGAMYQPLRSDLSRQANAARHSDPLFADALRGLRDALDNAMRRSISPADRAAWDAARARWGNWRTIERAAGQTDPNANVRISPAALRQAAASRDPGGFARGQGDFNELARAGNEILRPLPNSGTQNRLIGPGLLAGGAFAGGPLGLAAAFLPAAAGRAIMSGPVQRYLSNQRFQPPPPDQARRLRRTLPLLQFND